ncbi:MAG TPA: hypothetical protein VKA15_03915, partial [Isosphaeraceae bacterium]|nr:hypothetical protein [Isosphaeraceae bacterium]
VFVGNSPDILVLEDTDGDDRADKRYALLSGFGGIDSDHGVHGMVLGLDGKLYFTQGDGCCSVQKDKSERQQNFDVIDKSGRRVSTDQLANTLRVNREGTEFEVICDRQRNNYETCLNSFGNIFTSDNDDDGNRGCRVIWAMDGGRYGYHTPGSPRHWGEDVSGNVPKLVGTGNGSPAGIMVYEGNLLPEEYFGSVLEVDAGTRLILAFRNLPTDTVGDALKKLTASWDGQDRWYLEALGLALEKRASGFLSSLFDGSLYGQLDLERSGGDAKVALPPFFPVDRNEAFIPAGIPDQPASALSKYLGLAWRVHSNEVIPLLRKVVHHLNAPELQQAADDILRQLKAPGTAILVAEMIDKAGEPVRKRELLSVLGRNLEGQWRGAKDHETVEKVTLAALLDPQTRSQGIAIVSASRDARYDDVLESIARDEKLPEEERVASVQALGEIHGPAIHFLDHLNAATNGKPSSSPIANAAVRTVPHITDGRAITGLAVEDTPDRLVIKTADGQRIIVKPGDIENRKTSDVSLMPEGLAQTMSDQQLVELLAYLSTLREPVSIAGQYHVIGPLTEPGGAAIDPYTKIDLGATVRGPRQQVLAWHRLHANAEGLADLTAMVAGNAQNVVYAYTPVTSPVEQRASLAVETNSNLTVWSGGKPVITSSPTHLMSEPRGVEVTLAKGTSTLLIRLTGGGRPGGQATLVTTIVSAQPVSFTGGEASLS